MPKSASLLSLTPEEIGGHVWVEAEIFPKLPQDDLQAMQLAQAYRSAGPNGLPTLSDKDILTHVLHLPHAEAVIRRAELQALETGNPDIVKIRQAALVDEWKKANPGVVRAWEKAEETVTMTRAEFQQAVKVAAELEHAKMMGQDPAALVAAAEGQAQAQSQAALAPPTAMPYQENGPSPEVMPSQMGMGAAPQPMEMTPEVLADQMRRGRPQP